MVPSFIMLLEQLTPSSIFSEPDVGDAVVQLVVPDLRALNNVGPFVTVLIYPLPPFLFPLSLSCLIGYMRLIVSTALCRSQIV